MVPPAFKELSGCVDHSKGYVFLKADVQVVIYYVEKAQQWTVHVMVPLWRFTVDVVCSCIQVLSDTCLTWCFCAPLL